MLPTSARLLQLLSLLQARRFWLGAELAEELGVTGRSVRRDVDRLRSLGYPVHATSGVGGGYQLGAGHDLPPLPLDDEEALAVAVGLRVAAAGFVRGVEEASVRALSKLEQVLPKRLRRKLNALQTVSVRLGFDGAGIDATALTTLADACRDACLVRFEYSDHAGAVTTRHVEPYHLVHTSFRWYLLAYDLDRKDWRTFRVDRVGTKPRVGHPFAPRPLPARDVAEYVARAVKIRPITAQVTVFGPADEVAKRFVWMTGKAEPITADRCLVQVSGDSLEGLANWLGFLGYDFTIHDPPELADRVRALGERLMRATLRPAPRKR